MIVHRPKHVSKLLGGIKVEYTILHRAETDPLEFYRVKETEAELPQDAVRQALSEEQIKDHEFIVIQREEHIHRDEFDTAGTFDYLYEDYE